MTTTITISGKSIAINDFLRLIRWCIHKRFRRLANYCTVIMKGTHDDLINECVIKCLRECRVVEGHSLPGSVTRCCKWCLLKIASKRNYCDRKFVLRLRSLSSTPGIKRIIDTKSEILINNIDDLDEIDCFENRVRQLLHSRLADILLARFRGDTLQTIAKRLNLTRERVRQLESRAMAKVRGRIFVDIPRY